MEKIVIAPGLRRGSVKLPVSKSHLHRLLLADYLGGGTEYQKRVPGEAADLAATRRCLAALATQNIPELDCGESGSTLRFFLAVAPLLVRRAVFKTAGRLGERPVTPFLELLAKHGVKAENSGFPLTLSGKLTGGVYEVPGHISSQIVTGLLLALPPAAEDSRIICTTPLQSRGYVELTCQVLRQYGIKVEARENSWQIPGNQHYLPPSDFQAEADWSAAAAWLAMNRLGSEITVPGLKENSAQPDRVITQYLELLGGEINLSQSPDIFPVLAAAAGAVPEITRFTGVERLRFKESDRLSAMAQLLQSCGIETALDKDTFTVYGQAEVPGGGIIDTVNDHRIAMAAAVIAVKCRRPLTILNPGCVTKSYPDFFRQFAGLETVGVKKEPRISTNLFSDER